MMQKKKKENMTERRLGPLKTGKKGRSGLLAAKPPAELVRRAGTDNFPYAANFLPDSAAQRKTDSKKTQEARYLLHYQQRTS
jgi:hypothetical protein